MILEFSIENFQVYSTEVKFNLEADLRTKKFRSNVIASQQGNILKTAAIYGPNNTGKTCLMNAFRAYQAVLLNKPIKFRSNLFTDSDAFSLGAVFLWNGKRYEYFFRYDTKLRIFIEEGFSHIYLDRYGNKSKELFFYRNTENKSAVSGSDKLKEAIKLSSKDNILINTLDAAEFPLLQEAREALKGFAENVTVLSMQSLPPYKTIEMLKTPESPEAKQIIELIKKSDLDIDDFKYDERFSEGVLFEADEETERARGLQHLEKAADVFKLTSIHKGKALPSIIFDSLGTKKIVSLAGYLVECLNKGGCLLIDELDSGIHFKLSRAIVSVFNSSLNDRAQMIFSTHDASLLDIKTLFRKEQIWFTDKVEDEVYLYSLSDFTAENSGIRADSDLYERYAKGFLGALPDPSLIDVLIDIHGGEQNE
ncbi:MAG: ATP-binding protein [Synergistaceae bacterium]|nr:ATP-binding protein [Synergistaceae bacterium]